MNREDPRRRSRPGAADAASRPTRRAFSLIELIVVILILGTVTAIAIPRLTRGAENADLTAAKANARVLNDAIAMYAAEHAGEYPTTPLIEAQLTMYSSSDGMDLRTRPDPQAGVILGPYMLSIPELTYGPNTGASQIAGRNGDGIGWLYKRTLKKILPNLLDENDEIPAGTTENMNEDPDDYEGLRTP